MPLCHLFGHTTKNELNPNHIHLPGPKPIHDAFFFPSGAPPRATVITMDFPDDGEGFWPNKDTLLMQGVEFSSPPTSVFWNNTANFTSVYDPENFRMFSWASWFPSIIVFPTPLLGEIFRHILYNSDGTPVKNIEVKRILLRSTCRRWMHAVDTNPFLWRALVLEHYDLWYKFYNVPLSLVERFVRCSGEEPISISIDASLERHPEYIQTHASAITLDVFKMLIGPQGDVLKRWNSFKITCCDRFDISRLYLLGLWPAPLLTSVEINYPGQFGGIIELNSPMIRRIVHRECTLFFAPCAGFHFMALTDLTLWAPSAADLCMVVDLTVWVRILRQTPRLVSLRLRANSSMDELLPGPSKKEEIIQLSYLEQIFIDEEGPWKLLQYLRCRTLATMKIDGALSESFCDRLLGHAQYYDHLSHLKHLWFRSSIITTTQFTVEQAATFYRGFLARLFPKLNTLIVPFSIYGYSNQMAACLSKVWPKDEGWRVQIFLRLRDDALFPKRAVINGGEYVFKVFFEDLHDGSSGALQAHRYTCLRERRL